MTKKSFYEERTSEEDFGIYLESHKNLYGIIKLLTIEKVLSRFYPQFAGLKILEIGASGGIWTKYFLEKGAEVVAMDISEPALKINQINNPTAKFILGDAVTIKIDGKFDIIFAKDVIEHIEEDEKFLQNMNFHLKDDGLLVIITQNSWSLNYLIQYGYRRFLKGDKNWCGWAPDHKRFYNVKSLNKKLKKAGFKSDRWFGNYYFPYRIIDERMGVKKFSKIFCWVELMGLFDKPPFNIIGWGIGVIAKKVNNKNL